MTSPCPRCEKVFQGRTIGAHVKVCGVTHSELFWQKAAKRGPDECWLWTGSIKPRNGYGHFRVGRRDWNAHRYAYQDAVGPIPDGMHVLHRCDTPACVNPSHLWIGTHEQNMNDKLLKGRNQSILKPDDVREIRRLFQTMRNADIARKFRISESIIGNIKKGRIWKHVA